MGILDKLNDKQREAAVHKDGPLLILAGAGSGKTSTMTCRIAHLILDEGVNPYNILAVTFTKSRAANRQHKRYVDYDISLRMPENTQNELRGIRLRQRFCGL